MHQSKPLVEHFFRHQYGRMVARLTRSLGLRDLDLAEDCVQNAMLRAMRNWAERGLPADPEAWLFTVARNAARDSLRRNARHQDFLLLQTDDCDTNSVDPKIAQDEVVADDQLRLIFLCADPEIPIESRLALTLKIAAGFSVAEIARALLISEEAVQKRITRAKEKLRQSGSLSLELDRQLAENRVPEVQLIIYLIFNEGYYSTSDQLVIRRDLCEEAIRLAGLLESCKLGALPSTCALLALMHFHSARFDARVTEDGVVLFEDQDRSTWDWRIIRRGMSWMTRSLHGTQASRYHIESAIAWEHCRAASLEQTDWQRIAELYLQLTRLIKTPAIVICLAYAQSQFMDADKVLANSENDIPRRLSEVEQAQFDTLRAYLNHRAHRVDEAALLFESALRCDISASHKQSIQKLRDKFLKFEV